MKVYWTDAAVADLHAVEAYISRHSPRYANAMVHRIIDRTDSLVQHPLIGSLVPEYETESLRELLETPYRIIYQVLSEQIHVIAVLHAARRLPPSLPGMPGQE